MQVPLDLFHPLDQRAIKKRQIIECSMDNSQVLFLSTLVQIQFLKGEVFNIEKCHTINMHRKDGPTSKMDLKSNLLMKHHGRF